MIYSEGVAVKRVNGDRERRGGVIFFFRIRAIVFRVPGPRATGISDGIFIFKMLVKKNARSIRKSLCAFAIISRAENSPCHVTCRR